MQDREVVASDNSRGPWLVGLFTLILALSVAILGSVKAVYDPTDPGEPNPLAVINGESITSKQFLIEVRLSEAKRVMAGRRPEHVDQPTLFNRMIGDLLLLQGAREMKVSVEETAVQREIKAILRRLEYSAGDMNSLLAEHKLGWPDFERSVREYLLLSSFIDEVILKEIEMSERKGALQAWMRDQYRRADMAFDQAFLDSINSPIPTAG